MSEERVSPNLTFEQFKEYADRKPSLEGNWIYRVLHVYRGVDDCYPEFEVWTCESYFLSLEDAEEYMRKMVDDRKSDDPITYSFVISQIAVGVETYERVGASWLYDQKGRLVDYSITTWEDDPYKSGFFGRTESRMRFKKGDVVEICDGHSVRLAIVASDGPTVEWFWGVYNRSKEVCYGADASDDCYYTIDGPGFLYHSHTPTLAMMKPRLPIPADVKAYFEHCLEVADQDECTDKYRSFDGNLENLSTLSETEIKIRFDKSANRHILVKRVSDYVTGEKTYIPIKEDETDVIDMLNDVRYGKTRLWYIIRDWNENDQDLDEPDLWLDTPISQLLNS